MKTKDLFSLTDEKALVTGGGRGIGKALCNAMAEMGADVTVLDIDANMALDSKHYSYFLSLRRGERTLYEVEFPK